MKDEQLKAKSNAILDKLEEDGFDLDDWSIEDAHNNGFIDGYHEGFKDCAKSRLNVTTISDCPIKDEWHKQEIEDIYDLIAEDWSIKYFICIMKDKSRVTAIGNCDEGCNGEVSVNLFFDHDDEKYYLDDIVWWKEIVLPKESE